jgi:hypothetical protein
VISQTGKVKNYHHRTVSLEEAGFDDPLVFGNYTNTYGLITSLSGAQEVLALLGPVTEESELETIWTRRTGSTSPVPHVTTFLGIDMACSAPFWSIIADPPNDEFVRESVDRVNRSGLFQDEADTRRYLTSYRSAHPEKAGVMLYLCDVYAVRA